MTDLNQSGDKKKKQPKKQSVCRMSRRTNVSDSLEWESRFQPQKQRSGLFLLIKFLSESLPLMPVELTTAFYPLNFAEAYSFSKATTQFYRLVIKSTL